MHLKTLLRFMRFNFKIVENYRVMAKLMVEKLAWHLLALIAGHIIIQLIYGALADKPTLFNPFNAVFGTFMLVLLVLIVWRQGGLPLDLALIESFRDNAAAQAAVRVLMGYITIESIINVMVAITPLYAASWGALFSLLAVVPCYFLLRFMANESINWSNWVIFPLANILVLVTSIYYRWYANREPELTDPILWYLAGGMALCLSMVHTKFSLGLAGILFMCGFAIDAGAINMIKAKRLEVTTDTAITAISQRQLEKELAAAQTNTDTYAAIAQRNQAIRQERQRSRAIARDPEDLISPTVHDPTDFEQSLMGGSKALTIIVILCFLITGGVIFTTVAKNIFPGGSDGHH